MPETAGESNRVNAFTAQVGNIVVGAVEKKNPTPVQHQHTAGQALHKSKVESQSEKSKKLDTDAAENVAAREIVPEEETEKVTAKGFVAEATEKVKDVSANGSVIKEKVVPEIIVESSVLPDGSVTTPEVKAQEYIFDAKHYLDQSTVELITSLEAGSICEAEDMCARKRCTQRDSGEGVTSLCAASLSVGTASSEKKNQPDEATSIQL